MITEFEEHCQGSARVQFTVSKSSLPNLLEWTERLQARFRVTIDIQWEFDQDVASMRDREGAQVRWVSLSGHAEDCKKAKNYIIIFCDAPHKMNITYPENIHTELKESQTKLEEDFSSVLQFLKVGQLLLKSNDEMNLSLVLSVIEAAASHHEDRNMWRLKQPMTLPELGMQGKRYEEPAVLDTPDDDLDVDSIIEDPYDTDDVQPSKIRIQVTAPSETPSKQHSPQDMLGGVPLMLRGKRDVIFPGQLTAFFSPASSQDSVSPDRKKIKSQSHANRGDQSHLSVLDDFYLSEPHSTRSFTLSLSSQQKLAIHRLTQRGDYTQSEISRLLHKVGSDWKCSDLITMLRTERTRRNVPEAASHHRMPSSINLEKLRSTQESLIQSILVDVPPDPIVQGSSSDFWPKRFSTPTTQTGKLKGMQSTKTSKDAPFIKKEVFSGGNGGDGKYFQEAMEMKDPSGIDDMDSVIMVNDSDSIIIIPSESESEIVIGDGDSSGESDTHEEFYEKGVLQERRKKSRWGLSQRGSRPKHVSHSKQAGVEKQRTEELHGVVESLKQQLQDLQDKMEREKEEASSQQQVVTLLQQTQQEEMDRQYKQQQQKLLEQQQQFEKQFEIQQQKLKAQQEIALKQLQQQQQEKARALPCAPSEAIVIAPARKTPASPLRPVVIDGSNVAMSHGRRKIFSCRGIALCIQYFQKRGHLDITVFVPHHRRTQNPNKFDRLMADQKLLEQLEKQGLLSFTPSRRIGNSYVNCYDDRFIVELAVENDGVIVSNDNYRDLMAESQQWRYVIENRLVMFTFAGDHFMIPDDPMGRSGPHIDQLLRKSTHPASAAQVASHSGLTAPRQTRSILGQYPTPGSVLTLPSRTALMPLPSRTALIPVAGTGATQWGTGAMTGAQLVKRGAATTQQRPQPALRSKSAATTKPMLAATTKPMLAATTKPMLAATFGQKASGKDPTQHPCYETLVGIFPNNEDAVLQVLTKYCNTDDANELVIQVLVEKEKSESK